MVSGAVFGIPLAALALAARAAALGQEEDPVEVLARLRDQVLEHGKRIPNHTCVETVERDRYEPVGGDTHKSCDDLLAARKRANYPALLRLESSDRLRLDVLLAADRELYSWAGAAHFQENELLEWLPAGAIGTGPFAAMLLSIFEVHSPYFIYEGETTINGRRLLEYSFSISDDQSHYQVRAASQWVVSGYTGSLMVEPATAALVRLRARTEQLPEETTLCEIDSTLEYGMVPLSGFDYLLPVAARERYIGRNGEEAENAMQFSSCREYRGQSTVAFGGPAADRASPAAGPAAPAPVRWPAGLAVTVDVTSTIACDRAAAGDRIEGRLAKPVSDPASGAILAAAGTRLEGRLMRVETRHVRPYEVTVSLRWETIEQNGARAAIALRPAHRMPANLSPADGLRSRGMEIELPPPGESRYAVYRFAGEHPAPQTGLRTEWITAHP
jgi:hypothetical protein